MADLAFDPKSPVQEYARLLVELHALFVSGKDEDGDEADAIRDQMDRPWYAMTPQQRERVGGLSEDLYALAEAGPPRVVMTAEQLQAWRGEVAGAMDGDPDAALALLRRPWPDAVPRSATALLQARCWDRLGDPATATRFRAGAGDCAAAELLAG